MRTENSSDDLQGLLNYAYFFLKFRPRSKSEIHKYLLKKIKTRHWSSDDVERAIKKLEKETLINDYEFIRWLVEGRSNTRQKGERILRSELFRYGIAKDLIDEYFSKHHVDENDLAKKALSSRWSRFKNLTEEKRFQKAIAFLARRGFSFEVARSTIKKFEAEK